MIGQEGERGWKGRVGGEGGRVVQGEQDSADNGKVVVARPGVVDDLDDRVRVLDEEREQDDARRRHRFSVSGRLVVGKRRWSG